MGIDGPDSGTLPHGHFMIGVGNPQYVRKTDADHGQAIAPRDGCDW
jgi:hypothetical protein